MAQPGYFDTTIFGQPTQAPLIATLMNAWIAETENESVLALANQGQNSPAALAAACVAEGQNYINSLAIFNPPPPDASLATIKPYAQRIQFEAAFVPPSQFVPATFSINAPDTIAQCMAAAQAAVQPAPPPPPANPVGVCYNVGGAVMCEGATGVTPAMFTDGEVVMSNGQSYVAHITQQLMGPELWFTPKS